jgi:hypothetical protein
MKSSVAILLTPCLALWTAAATAAAQPGASAPAPPGPAAPPAIARRGLIVEGGLGFGPKGFRGDGDGDFYAERAFAYQLGVGWMLTPRLALGGELFGWSHRESFDEGPSTDYEQHLGVWLRTWVLPRLWLQGGLDLAREGVDLPPDHPSYTPHKGIGLSGVAGFELLHLPRAAIDLALRVAAARYAERDAFMAESDPASASAAVVVHLAFWL